MPSVVDIKPPRRVAGYFHLSALDLEPAATQVSCLPLPGELSQHIYIYTYVLLFLFINKKGPLWPFV